MKEITCSEEGLTIGLDVSDRVSHVCVLGADGTVHARSRVATEPGALRARFEGLAPLRVVLEAGTHSHWMARLLGSLGHEVIVGNPRKLRLIFANERKSDVRDAEQLARLGRLDPSLLYPTWVRSEHSQAGLAVMDARDALVRARSRLICTVRALIKGAAQRAPACSAEAFARKVRPFVPAALEDALVPLIETIADLSMRVRAYERKIEELCEQHAATALLRQVPGVGPLSALRFVLSVEEPARFAKSRSLGPWLGLVPRRDQSGGRDPGLPITKTGNARLRRLLVQAAHYVLGPFGPPSELRACGERIAAAGGAGAKKRAVVAVARKLAVLLHRLWVTGEIYRPLASAGEPARAA